MQILLDENIPGLTEKFLASSGHSVKRPPKSAKDKEIFSLAESTGALLLTRDKDFLAFSRPTKAGIIVIRIHPSIAEAITEAIKRLLESKKDDWFSKKVVVLHKDGFEVIK